MDFLVRRGRGLDPAVLAWIMGTLGVGPGIGEVHFVVKEDSAYYSWLRDDMRMNSSLIHHTVTAGEDALTASRNDVLCVYPGAYDETARIAWTKSFTHMIGLGGLAVGSDYTEPIVNIYSDTASLAEIIDVTGNAVQFHNLHISNVGNAVDSFAALTLDGYSCTFRNCAFSNMMTAGSDGVEAAAAVYIAQLGAHCLWDNCIFGQDEWDERTANNSGVLRFINTSSSGGPKGGRLYRCQFRSRSDTIGVCMVAIPSNYGIGRNWLFEDCSFVNFSTDHTYPLTQCFYDACATTHDIILKNCVARGITEWKTVAGQVYIDMPAYNASGGIATAAAA